MVSSAYNLTALLCAINLMQLMQYKCNLQLHLGLNYISVPLSQCYLSLSNCTDDCFAIWLLTLTLCSMNCIPLVKMSKYIFYILFYFVKFVLIFKSLLIKQRLLIVD